MVDKMSSRERVIQTLNHKEPDMVPLDIGGGTSTSIVVEGYEKLKSHLNVKEETKMLNRIFRLAKVSQNITKILGCDCLGLGIKPPINTRSIEIDSNSFTDIWGVTWKKAFYQNNNCFYYEVQNSPLADATISDLENYNWPDPLDEGYTMGLAEDSKNLYENTEYALVGDAGFKSFWELGYLLRGFENLFMDLAVNQKFFIALMEKLLEINIIATGRYLDIVGKYIQVFRTADDMSSQRGLIMAPETYRKLIKPIYKKYYEFIKSKTDAKIFYHSCGNVTGLLDDLIDIGLDIINPVQVSAMGDMEKIKKRFGNDLVFWGGIDTQHILPNGSVSEVMEEVHKRIMEMAHGGGYVIGSVHNIQPDVPPTNIVAMASAAKKFGKYPLSL